MTDCSYGVESFQKRFLRAARGLTDEEVFDACCPTRSILPYTKVQLADFLAFKMSEGVCDAMDEHRWLEAMRSKRNEKRRKRRKASC